MFFKHSTSVYILLFNRGYRITLKIKSVNFDRVLSFELYVPFTTEI